MGSSLLTEPMTTFGVESKYGDNPAIAHSGSVTSANWLGKIMRYHDMSPKVNLKDVKVLHHRSSGPIIYV